MNEKDQLAIEALQKAAAYYRTDSLSFNKYKAYRSNYDPLALSASTISKQLGNWSNALHQAGLNTGQGVTCRCTRCGKRLKKEDTNQEYCQKCLLTEPAQINNILKLNGEYSEQAICLALQAAAKSSDSELRVPDYRKFVQQQYPIQYPSHSTVIKTFKTWEAALKAAGLHSIVSKRALSKPVYTENQLIEVLKLAAKQVQSPLTTTKYLQLYSNPSTTLIRQRFGSWSKALKAAGIIKEENV